MEMILKFAYKTMELKSPTYSIICVNLGIMDSSRYTSMCEKVIKAFFEKAGAGEGRGFIVFVKVLNKFWN